MKSLLLTKFSKIFFNALDVAEVPPPQISDGCATVRMAAAALNPADLHIASGEMKMFSPKRPPFALGVDGAGIVISDGKHFKTGDRVMFYTGLVHCGTLAEQMSVPEDWLAPVPTSWTDAEAAAAPLALLVAFKALERTKAKKGESILVSGAGGPVGAATIALAKYRGLNVYGLGSPDDEAYVKSLGAETFASYRSPSTSLPLKSFDILLDCFGGKTMDLACKSVKPGGRIVSLKAMTGIEDMEAQGMRIPFIIKLLIPIIFRRARKAAERSNAKLIGLASYPDGTALSKVAQEAVSAGFRPRIDTEFTLLDYKSAFERLGSHPRGKVIVKLA